MKGEPWTKVYESACADSRLSDRDLRVLIAVKLRARESGSCWESVETIGKRAGGMSGRTVRRSLEVLKKFDYLDDIPDPGKKTGRRLTPVKSDTPPRTAVADTPDKSDTPPRTNLTPNVEHRSRAQDRTTTKTGGSPSSSKALAGDIELGRNPAETEAEAYARLAAEDALAKAFPGLNSQRVSSAIGEYGVATVAAAAKSYRPEDRRNEWGYFLGICRGMNAEGGPPPSPAPGSPCPHRMTKAERNAERDAIDAEALMKLFGPKTSSNSEP